MSDIEKEVISIAMEQVCDELCKYPDRYDSFGASEQAELLEKYCFNCPLNRLDALIRERREE